MIGKSSKIAGKGEPEKKVDTAVLTSISFLASAVAAEYFFVTGTTVGKLPIPHPKLLVTGVRYYSR